MLHSLPALLDELERRLIAGEDPLPLLGSVRWPDVIDWPRSIEDAKALKRRIASVNVLINGLQAPLRATLMGLDQTTSYKPKGGTNLPSTLSLRFQQSV